MSRFTYLQNYYIYCMKKKIVFFSVVALLAIVVTSCQKEVSFQEVDLLGLWQEEGTEAFVRFTAENDSTGEYKYGREWDESDEMSESDLKPYGNGWFKYKLVKSDLTEIHLMDNGGAEFPKVYTVLHLTEDALEYKDDRGVTTTFAKVVE